MMCFGMVMVKGKADEGMVRIGGSCWGGDEDDDGFVGRRR